MKFTIIATILATLALTSAAPSLKRQAECPACDNCGYNHQNFTGDLGGLPPPVYGTKTGFETCGKEYDNGGAYDALVASCGIQVDNCEELTNSGQTACNNQYSSCKQQALYSGGR